MEFKRKYFLWPQDDLLTLKWNVLLANLQKPAAYLEKLRNTNYWTKGMPAYNAIHRVNRYKHRDSLKDVQIELSLILCFEFCFVSS